MKEFFYMIWEMPASSFLFGMSCLCACVWSVRYMRYKEFEERRQLNSDALKKYERLMKIYNDAPAEEKAKRGNPYLDIPALPLQY